jgi:hypothetical protein
MKRVSKFLTASLLPFSFASMVSGHTFAQSLDSFAILAGSVATNTGASIISGNVGVSPGAAITGFPPGIVTAPYAIHSADAIAARAQSDLTIAYNALAARAPTSDLTGQDLGGLTLTPGVYNFNTSSQLTGALTLDGGGNPNAVFIFKIGSTLTTASASVVQLINGAQGRNVFFQVGSSATLGTTTSFAGKILALANITLNTGAQINCGAALAQIGAVTLDTNVVSVCALAAATYDSIWAPPLPTINGPWEQRWTAMSPTVASCLSPFKFCSASCLQQNSPPHSLNCLARPQPAFLRRVSRP